MAIGSIPSRIVLVVIASLTGLGTAASTQLAWDSSILNASPAAERKLSGRMIILPGIRNTKFHLKDFARRSASLLPDFEIEIRPWGTPLLGLQNLRAAERNLATAEAFAKELTEWRRERPEEKIYVVGYSGGGGLAALILSALPEDIAIDRLILVAPAISSSYDVSEQLLPHVNEFVVNYASEKDLQVGFGTRLFGTIDRKKEDSAGYGGFTAQHARLAEWRWESVDRHLGHRGNHVGYLGRRWQMAHLLPALDPANDSRALEAHWRSVRLQSAPLEEPASAEMPGSR